MNEITMEQCVGTPWFQNYWMHSGKREQARNFSRKDWLQNTNVRSNKTKFEYCENSKGSLVYIRAIQGHTGCMAILPASMVHILIPCDWKEFIFHKGCLDDSMSINKNGLVAGRKESKEDTIFFTPLKHFGENPDEEEPSEDFSKPRKVHHHRNWKHNQDAENWKIVQSTRSWIFEQTKSNAIIVFDPAAEDCIERIANETRDRILFERILTPRPVPKITLKSCWQAS